MTREMGNGRYGRDVRQLRRAHCEVSGGHQAGRGGRPSADDSARASWPTFRAVRIWAVTLWVLAATGVGGLEVVRPDYPDDPTVWPNRTSSANSDPWLVEHHRSLRRMEPRILVINFANGCTAAPPVS